MRRASLTILTFFLAAVPVLAQPSRDRDSLGNNNSIAVTVYGPSGRPVAGGVRVTLRSEFAREDRCSTDDDGECTFDDLSNGTYSVTVEGGDDLETVTQTTRIDRPPLGLPESIRMIIHLKDRTVKVNKPGVLRAENAGVPKKALEHYDKALALSGQNDPKGAIKELQAAIAEHPAFPIALTELGVQQLKLGQLTEADASFAAALAIKPDLYEALVNRGIGLFRQAKFADSESSLRAALKLKADSTVGHFYLGRSLMGLSKLDDAEKELLIVLGDAKSQIVEAHRMLTQLYIQKQEYAKALAQLDSYLAANPKAPDDAKLRRVQKQLQDAVAMVKAQPNP